MTDTHQSYAHAGAWIRSGLLRAGAIAVLAALASMAHTSSGGGEIAYTAAPQLAKLTSSSLSQTRRRLEALTKHGAIEHTQRGNRYRASGWRILPPPR